MKNSYYGLLVAAICLPIAVHLILLNRQSQTTAPVNPNLVQEDQPLPCLKSPEICNNFDDDCDGEIDDGFDLSKDSVNCGVCGLACPYYHACENGRCHYDSRLNQCEPEPWGCSYKCRATGPEICDYKDNDCDGWVDFDLANDPDNCGACGLVCADGQSCSGGYCAWNTPQNKCVLLTEICDYKDNNCDGKFDEDFNLLTDWNNCGSCGHACQEGQYCQNGSCAWMTPVSECRSEPETCNDIDDDCNGLIDDGINLLNDDQNCGACGTVCAPGLACINASCL